jgi:AraC family transcriptional regulator, arabinose operon regulatory protein
MEHIISFLPDENRTYTQYHIDMTGITYPDPNYVVDRKNSNIYCIEYVINGEGTVHVDDQVFYPSKGDVYILPIGRHQHYYSSHDNPWEKIWMNVYGPLCDALFQVYHLENILWIKDLDLYHLFKQNLDLCEQKDLSTSEVFEKSSLIFHEILAKISMYLYKTPITKNVVAYKAKEYIDKNIYDRFTMDDIAKIACLSPSQANRVFKKEYGITPYDYILSKKIETAKLLLINTNISIKNIAYKLNFLDEHYFSKIFKARTGTSPKSYRR